MSQAVFSSMASDYDEVFTNSEIGKLQRSVVWDYMNKQFRIDEELRVLELNCGTGHDAINFAKRGSKVMATDNARGMLDVAIAKAGSEGVAERIEFKELDINRISEFSPTEKFDLVFSNFGGLNCIDPKGLSHLANSLGSILKPGGRFVSVIMPDKCMMETLYFLLKLQFDAAFRRGRQQVEWSNANGDPAIIRYYGPKVFTTIFSERFERKAVMPVGLFIPPSYMQPFFDEHKFLLKGLSGLDRVARYSFLARIADHYLVDLKIRN